MTDRRDDILDEIGQLLAIERSPEFAARVRTNVEGVVPGLWRVRVMWMAAAAAAVVLAGAASEFGRVREPVLQPVRVVRGDVALTTPVVATTPAVVGARPQAAVRQPAMSVGIAPIEPAKAGDPTLDLTVVTNQPDLLRRMWARFDTSNDGVLVVARVVAGPELPAMADPGPAVVVTEIIPTPIVVTEFDHGHEDTGQVFRKSIQ